MPVSSGASREVVFSLDLVAGAQNKANADKVKQILKDLEHDAKVTAGSLDRAMQLPTPGVRSGAGGATTLPGQAANFIIGGIDPTKAGEQWNKFATTMETTAVEARKHLLDLESVMAGYATTLGRLGAASREATKDHRGLLDILLAGNLVAGSNAGGWLGDVGKGIAGKAVESAWENRRDWFGGKLAAFGIPGTSFLSAHAPNITGLGAKIGAGAGLTGLATGTALLAGGALGALSLGQYHNNYTGTGSLPQIGGNWLLGGYSKVLGGVGTYLGRSFGMLGKDDYLEKWWLPGSRHYASEGRAEKREKELAERDKFIADRQAWATEHLGSVRHARNSLAALAMQPEFGLDFGTEERQRRARGEDLSRRAGIAGDLLGDAQTTWNRIKNDRSEVNAPFRADALQGYMESLERVNGIVKEQGDHWQSILQTVQEIAKANLSFGESLFNADPGKREQLLEASKIYKEKGVGSLDEQQLKLLLGSAHILGGDLQNELQREAYKRSGAEGILGNLGQLDRYNNAVEEARDYGNKNFGDGAGDKVAEKIQNAKADPKAAQQTADMIAKAVGAKMTELTTEMAEMIGERTSRSIDAIKSQVGRLESRIKVLENGRIKNNAQVRPPNNWAQGG